MHPKILQFWIDAGYNPYETGEYYDSSGVHNYWAISPYSEIAIIYQYLAFSNKYFFAGNKYSEEEMLKIIKLKSFA